jgi:hypothetical protein
MTSESESISLGTLTIEDVDGNEIPLQIGRVEVIPPDGAPHFSFWPEPFGFLI